MNTSGKEVIPLVYEQVEPFKDSSARVFVDNIWKNIDVSGNDL